MKFNFKIQQYQTDAVDAVVNVFAGQPYSSGVSYIRDTGTLNQKPQQLSFLTLADNPEQMELEDLLRDSGYKNEAVALSDNQLLQNIHTLQSQNNIKLSPELVHDMGRCSLDIEMETGTGKTYVYIKTMFELNKKYGWSKFIVVVPSIAIREGVKKSFEITTDHFMEYYGKKARFFVYNSSNLNQLDNFSSNSGINVMIINTQAFASSLKEDGRSKEARIIYSKRDEFGSRRPIDVILRCCWHLQYPIFSTGAPLKYCIANLSFHQINDNLEQQAKAIFDDHFINIDTIPAGWKKGNLLDIANYLNGLAMQKFRPQRNEIGLPVLKIKELRQGSCDDSSELCSLSIKPEYIIHDGDVIFSWSGSLLVDIWCGGICGLNQHLFKVTSDVYDKWFYYLWTAHHLARFIAIAADKATTMGHIKREELAKAEVLIPCEEDYTSLNSIMQPIFELIISNRIESRKLAALRDELLPKLMSGEIDVSAVQL